MIYPKIHDNPQTVFSFLLIAGYLKIIEKLQSPTGNSFCRVAIPNKEIQCIYGKEILSSMRNPAIRSSAAAIQQAILSRNAEALRQIDENRYESEMRNKGIREILKFGIAFYGKQTAVSFRKDEYHS